MILQVLAKHGKKGFYEGPIAEAVIDAVKAFDGVMTLHDLASHQTTFDDPISVEYKGVRLWEIPPNGQGIVALMTLNLLKPFDLKCKLNRSVNNTLVQNRPFQNASKTIILLFQF